MSLSEFYLSNCLISQHGDCDIHFAKHIISASNLLYFTNGKSVFTIALTQVFLSLIKKKKEL